MKIKNGSINRRTFIKSLCGVGTALYLSTNRVVAKEKAAIYKLIPKTNEQLPVIGVGSSRTFDVGNNEKALQKLVPVLQAFFDNGGALIDSSPMYGTAEQVIGQLLTRVSNKDKLFAATKVWEDGKEEGIAQMQRSMQLMGVKAFDLMQIHNLRDWQVHLDTLKAWKEQGKVRYIGITTSHGRFHQELERILKKEPFDFVQFSYNIGNREVEERLLPLAAEQGIATLINRPFQRGALFKRVKGLALPDWSSEFECASWGQFFLKFIVSHPAVTCAIPATSKVHHMVDNMGAGIGQLPDTKTRQRMIDYYLSL